MTTEQIQELADDLGLSKKEVLIGNSSISGYPTFTGQTGYTGFKEFADAERFASKTKGEVVLFKFRDGWYHTFVCSIGSTDHSITVEEYVNRRGDNCRTVDYHSEESEMFELIEDFAAEENLEEIKKIIVRLEDLEDAFNAVGVDQTIVYEAGDYDLVDDIMMIDHHDVTTFIIGVLIEEEQDEEEEEDEL